MLIPQIIPLKLSPRYLKGCQDLSRSIEDSIVGDTRAHWPLRSSLAFIMWMLIKVHQRLEFRGNDADARQLTSLYGVDPGYWSIWWDKVYISMFQSLQVTRHTVLCECMFAVVQLTGAHLYEGKVYSWKQEVRLQSITAQGLLCLVRTSWSLTLRPLAKGQ